MRANIARGGIFAVILCRRDLPLSVFSTSKSSVGQPDYGLCSLFLPECNPPYVLFSEKSSRMPGAGRGSVFLLYGFAIVIVLPGNLLGLCFKSSEPCSAHPVSTAR